MMAFFGSRRMRTSAGSSRSCRVATTGSRPDELGDEPVLEEVLRLHHGEQIAHPAVLAALDLGAEAHAALAHPVLHDLVEPHEGAAADEEDVVGVDLDELLVGMLAPALGRHVGHRALEDLEERLLDALPGDVAGDGGVLGLPRDLVDLVDVDDAALGPLHVVVRRLEQAQDDVLHVLAHVARLGEGGGVGDGERAPGACLARVWARRVLPEPVGPISRMFAFCSSTSPASAPASMRL